MDDYKRGGHSKYSLKIHLIFVTKYRRKVFEHSDVNVEIKNIFEGLAHQFGFVIDQMETDLDHIHFLVDYPPILAVSDIVAKLKQYSTHRLWQTHGRVLSQYYWKHKVLWSDGWFACSIGQVSAETVRQYIENQG